MITRIRYKTDKGIMTNVTPLFAKTHMITVTIDLTKMSFVIVNDEGDEVALGFSTSKQKILNKVKEEVKRLGVVFHDEIRPRKVTKKSKTLLQLEMEETENRIDTGNPNYISEWPK